jgi:hypothetical protein
LEALLQLKALDANTGRLSQTGWLMVQLLTHSELSSVHLAKTILEGNRQGIPRLTLAFAAMVSVPGQDEVTQPWLGGARNAKLQRAFMQKHFVQDQRIHVSQQGDAVVLAHLLLEFEKTMSDRKQWCQDHGLRYSVLRRASTVYTQLLKTLQRLPGTTVRGYDLTEAEAEEKGVTKQTMLRKVVTSGFFRNTYQRTRTGYQPAVYATNRPAVAHLDPNGPNEGANA